MSTTIGNININLQGLFGSAPSSAVGQTADKDGDNDAGGSTGSVRRGHGGGQLLNAVAQTLSQLGLGQVGQIAVTAPSASQNASGNNTNDSVQNVDQALHTFMHSLFQAINQSSGNTQTANPSASNNDGESRARTSGATGTSGYTNLVSKLQNFVQSMASGSSSASSATSDLNSAFQNLEKALSANTSTTNSAGGTTLPSPSLQSFLQSLLLNLQNAGSTSMSGTANLVNTSA